MKNSFLLGKRKLPKQYLNIKFVVENVHQTPLDFASPSKTRYTKMISLNVSIANLDD